MHAAKVTLIPTNVSCAGYLHVLHRLATILAQLTWAIQYCFSGSHTTKRAIAAWRPRNPAVHNFKEQEVLSLSEDSSLHPNAYEAHTKLDALSTD